MNLFKDWIYFFYQYNLEGWKELKLRLGADKSFKYCSKHI